MERQAGLSPTFYLQAFDRQPETSDIVDKQEARINDEALLVTLTDQEDMAALTKTFDDEIESGQDGIGVAAWRAPDGIRFFFPVFIVVRERNGA